MRAKIDHTSSASRQHYIDTGRYLRACPFGTTNPEECMTIRERLAAGTPDPIADCPEHGPFIEPDTDSGRCDACGALQLCDCRVYLT